MQQPFFDAKTLQRVKDLPMAIKTLAQGFLQGTHTSQQRGVGVEFSQFRAYEPGDELSKIDWKLFARSDKYFVREAERESDVNVWLVLDCSESMLQRSAKAPSSLSSSTQQRIAAEQTDLSQVGQWHKLDYARYLSATIAYLAQKQGDAVGLLTLSGQQNIQMPAFPGSKHWQKILIALTKLKAKGILSESQQVLKHLSAIQANGLVVMISDFHQHSSEALSLLKQLKNSKTDVIAFHLDSDDEINFPYQGLIKFQDLESAEYVTVDAKDIRADYLSEKSILNEQFVAQCRKHNIDYFVANIDQALDQSLVNFLQARKRGRGR